jgi:Mrp family chromosome partitioning ATPase
MSTAEQGPFVTMEQAVKEKEEQRLRERMQQVRQKLIVLSGKGGVGKSTVAANLAVALARQGRRVGLLDVDIHGPSIPKLMGLEGRSLGSDGSQILPVELNERLAVMSIGFLVGSTADAVIWRGPLKHNVIRQFLADVAWGALDYLVVDSPPGTGDEPLSVAQLVGQRAGAVIVTTPQELAVADVRRCVTFCEKASLPVIGIVENMSGFVCPRCGYSVDLFGRGGGEALAREMRVRFLGRIPIDPEVVSSGDSGKPFVESPVQSPAAKAFAGIVGLIAGADRS